MSDKSLPAIRRFYRKYLAGFPPARVAKRLWLASAGRLLSNPKFKAIRMSLFAPQYRLISLSEYRAGRSVIACTIAEGGTKTVRGPVFVNTEAPSAPYAEKMHVPPVDVIEHTDATVMAASNFVFRDGFAIHPDSHDPARDVTMLERFKVIEVDTRKGAIRYEPSILPVRIEAGISLLHQSAGNYAHFMTEVLPKLVLIDRERLYRGLPLLVDKWMHPNHIEAIRMFAREKREIIGVDPSSPATISRLIEITPPAIAPPDLRSHIERGVVENVGADAYAFNAEALTAVRDSAQQMSGLGEGAGERLFLYRKTQPYGNARACVNMDRLASAARKAGFTIIEAGSLSFGEQIAAFRKARAVIAPVGAALVNLMFANPRCRVLCLAPVFDGANYHYFARLMGSLGHDMRYVVGPQVNTGAASHIYHRDYEIDAQEFYRGLQWVTNGLTVQRRKNAQPTTRDIIHLDAERMRRAS